MKNTFLAVFFAVLWILGPAADSSADPNATGRWAYTAANAYDYCTPSYPDPLTSAVVIDEGSDGSVTMQFEGTDLIARGYVFDGHYVLSREEGEGKVFTKNWSFTLSSSSAGSGTYATSVTSETPDPTAGCGWGHDFTLTYLGSGNSPPTAPVPVSPADGAVDVSLTPVLMTQAFSDPDTGDTHAAAEWDLSSSPDFSSTVLYENTADRLTDMTVPAMALEPGRTYYWRVRFTDSSGQVSGWSDAVSFTTLNRNDDINNNGIPDNLENSLVDLNQDGTADIHQTDVIKSLNTVVGDGQMGVSAAGSDTVTQIVEINSIDPDDISEIIRPDDMTLGLFSCRMTVASAGDTAEVTFYLSTPAPAGARWYFHDSISGWTDFSDYAVFSADRRSVTVTLQDGGPGDSDGVANGIIVDPCGFGVASWIKGQVTDLATSDGISNGTLTITDTGFSVNTLPDGSFISMILPGSYTISVSASGYQTVSLTDIQISEGTVTTRNAALPGECRISGLTVTGTPSATAPATFQVTTAVDSGTVFYRYSLHPGYGTAGYDGKHWTLMTADAYVDSQGCTYTFDGADKYIVVVWATALGTVSVNPDGIPIIGWSVDTESACPTRFTQVSISGEQTVNRDISMTVTADNPCSGTLYYRFSMHPFYGTTGYDGRQWELMTDQEWVETSTVHHTFTRKGKYIVVVWVTGDISSVSSAGIPIVGWSMDIR